MCCWVFITYGIIKSLSLCVAPLLTQKQNAQSLSQCSSRIQGLPPPVGIMTNKDDRALIMVRVCECIQTHQCNLRWQIRPPAGSYEKRTDRGGRHRNKHCATSDKHETHKQRRKNPRFPLFTVQGSCEHTQTHSVADTHTHTHTHTCTNTHAHATEADRKERLRIVPGGGKPAIPLACLEIRTLNTVLPQYPSFTSSAQYYQSTKLSRLTESHPGNLLRVNLC